MYENSTRVARITMTVATAPPSAVADHVKADDHGDPPPLRSLTLEQVSLEHDFVDFMSRLSHLEYLRLDTCRITAEHLGALILDSDIPHDNMVCPRLATLSLSDKTPVEVLFKMVQSRAPLCGIP